MSLLEKLYSREENDRRIAILTRIRDILSGLPKRGLKFDISSWGSESDELAALEDHACGTSCCAIGYACLDPEIQKYGLSGEIFFDLDSANSDERIPVKTVEEFNKNIVQPDAGLMPVFRNESGLNSEGWEAVNNLLRWDEEFSDYLFSGNSYDNFEVGEAEVIARIDGVIKILRETTGEDTNNKLEFL